MRRRRRRRRRHPGEGEGGGVCALGFSYIDGCWWFGRKSKDQPRASKEASISLPLLPSSFLFRSTLNRDKPIIESSPSPSLTRPPLLLVSPSMVFPSAPNGVRERLPTLDEVLLRKTRPPVDLFCFYVSLAYSQTCLHALYKELMRISLPSLLNRSSFNGKGTRIPWISGWTFINTRTSAELTSR